MVKLLNLQTLSKTTQKKIRDAAGVLYGITKINIKDLIKLAKGDGVDLGKRKDTQIKRAYEYFGEIENMRIEEENKKKKDKALAQSKKPKKVKVNKNVIVDMVDVPFNSYISIDEEINGELIGTSYPNPKYIEFGNKIIQNSSKLVGSSYFYIQLTLRNHKVYEDGPGSWDDRIGEMVREFEIIKKNVVIHKCVNITGKDKYKIWYDDIRPLLFIGGDYNDSGSFLLNEDCLNFRLVILPAMSNYDLPPKKIQQSYREGERHCVIEPLYLLWQKMADNSESPASKKRCQQIANKIKALEVEYADGVPEDDMEKVADVAKRCLIIHDIIGNETKRYNTKSTKYFHFTNTRKNHIDENYITMDKQFEPVDVDKLNEIIKNADFALLGGDINQPSNVRTKDGAYAIYNEEYEIFNKFSNDLNINNYSINAVKYPELNAFIKESRLINSAPVSLCANPNDLEDVKHADIEKAYTQHKLSKYYCGFLGKIQQFVKGSFDINFIKKNIGIYKVLIIENTNKLLVQLGIHKNKYYSLPSPELIMMSEKGVTFKIIGGCFGSSFDFEYTDEMLENRNYCIWAGKLGMDKEYNTYSFKGDAEWAAHLKYELGDDKVLFFKEKGLILIKVKKLSYSTNHHILAFITSYTRINMLEIMENIEGELVKVILDGIYYKGTINEVNIPYKDKELKKHAGFGDSWYNESLINSDNWAEFDERFNGNCVFAGAGGCGKSHAVFNNKGLIDVMAVVPTNELGNGKRYTTIHRLIGEDCQSYRSMYKKVPSVLFIDELTMIEEKWIEKAISMYPECLFIIAGDIDKKQWYQCRSGYTNHFSKIWMGLGWRFVYFENDYRALDDELKTFKIGIRNEMKRIFTNGDLGDTLKIKQYILNNHSSVSFEEAIKEHKNGDMWIVGTHKTEEKLEQNNISCSYNDKVKPSFTIHSFQGQTIEDRKVFIKMDMFEYAMYYTAISRVRHYSQIVLVR